MVLLRQALQTMEMLLSVYSGFTINVSNFLCVCKLK